MDRVTYWYVALCISKVSCFARTFTNQILFYNPVIYFISVCSEGVDDGRPERGVHHRQHAHHGKEQPEAQEGQEAVVTLMIIVMYKVLVDVKSTIIIFILIVNYVLINKSL